MRMLLRVVFLLIAQVTGRLRFLLDAGIKDGAYIRWGSSSYVDLPERRINQRCD